MHTSIPQRELIRVALAESTIMGGQMLAQLLRRDKGLDITDVSDDPQKLLAALNADVVILSARVESDGVSAFDLLRDLKSVLPCSRLVMLLDELSSSQILKAFRQGARGVFFRSDSGELLAKCIHRVHEGQIWANARSMELLLEALANAPATNVCSAEGEALLSKREQQVVRFVAEGLGNREIAEQLKLSEHTVKNYLFRIFNKLGVSNRVELVLYAASQRASGDPVRDQN